MGEQATSSNSEKLALNRRDVLAWAGAAATMGAAQVMATPASSAFRVSDLVMVDAITLADAIRSRQVSCVEVMTAYLDHIEKLNPKVNAIVALQDRAALLAQASERDAQLARGELMGDGFSLRCKGFGAGQRYQDDVWLSNSERFCRADRQHHGRTATQSRCNIHRQDQHA